MSLRMPDADATATRAGGVLRFGLLAVVAFLGIAAAHIAVLTLKRQATLNEASQYDVMFDASQGQAELLRLEAAMGDFAVSPSPAARTAIAVRLEILSNRAKVLEADHLARLLGPRDDLTALPRRLAEAIEALRPGLSALDGRWLARGFAILAPLNAPMGNLASLVHTKGGDLVKQAQSALQQVHWLFSMVLLALVGCGFGLVVLLHRHSKKAHHAARHDPLTGLPNRLVVRDRLGLIAASGTGTLLLLDLDHFKDVNDTLGHLAGDALLREAAARLRATLPPGATLARLGGDEFAVLLTSGGRAAAGAVAASLIHTVTRPFEIGGTRVALGLSVGIASADGPSTSVDALMRQADMGLYSAKEYGRGTYRFFVAEMEERQRSRFALIEDLREALDRDELSLAFQPLRNLATRRVVGFEALLRWNHPRRGLVPPAEFIPLAEETGLVLRIGEWVLARATKVAVGWPDDIRISVNFSPVQFSRGRVSASVAAALAASGLAPGRLEVEITESVLLQDDDSVRAVLESLRRIGVRVALDDFGTGYCSLGYLRRFAFDKIKIDQSFVRGMTDSADCGAIVEAIASLASRLRMTSLAEGIESEALLDAVCRAGCVEGQGYHLDPPLSEADACERVATQAATDRLAAGMVGRRVEIPDARTVLSLSPCSETQHGLIVSPK